MRPLWRYYNHNNSYRIDTTPSSPALEVSLSDASLINPLPRFSSIFAPLLASDLEMEDRRALENVFLHYLALLDFACGLDRRELYLKRYHEELKDGLWGENVGSAYATLNSTEQRDIQNFLYEQEIKDAPCLGRLLKKWFQGILYYHVLEINEIILAIPSAGEETDRQKLNLILDLFAPLRQAFRICWQKTPCLLDAAEGVLDACELG